MARPPGYPFLYRVGFRDVGSLEMRNENRSRIKKLSFFSSSYLHEWRSKLGAKFVSSVELAWFAHVARRVNNDSHCLVFRRDNSSKIEFPVGFREKLQTRLNSASRSSSKAHSEGTNRSLATGSSGSLKLSESYDSGIGDGVLDHHRCSVKPGGTM